MNFCKFPIIPAVVTMFDKDGKVDEQAQRAIVRELLNKKAEGFYIAGATGEGFLMDVEERKKVIKICVEEIGGKVPAIAYTGANDTNTAVELTKYAESIGADAVSSVPPYFGAFSFEMIKDYYTKIAQSVKIPMLMYTNVLTRSFSIAETKELCDIPNCAGMKYTNHNHYMMKMLKLNLKDKLIFSGADEMIGSAMLTGIDGAIGTTYNFAPELFIAQRDAFLKGDMQEFLRLNEAGVLIVDAFVNSSFLPSLKAILSYFGIGQGYCRRPNASFNQEQIKPLIEKFKKIRDDYNLEFVDFLNRL